MNPIQVNPAAWQKHEVIFNEEGFSAIWGQFRGEYCVGTRWNGATDEERGYPGQAGNPLWFVIPDYLTISLLERLNTISLQRHLMAENGEPYSARINRAMREFMNQDTPAEQN